MDSVRDAGNQASIKVKIGLASLNFEDFVACTPKPEETATPEGTVATDGA